MQLNLEHFDTFPILKTKRLTLRKLTEKDASEIYNMRSNSRINEFIPRPLMSSFEDSRNLVNDVQEMYQNKKGIAWSGELRSNKNIIGTCGFNNIEIDNLRAEIGGEMNTYYWGKKIALEAVEAIINFGFASLKLQTIEAKVSPLNRGAVHILEALGFEKEAHFKKRGYYKESFVDMAAYTAFTPY